MGIQPPAVGRKYFLHHLLMADLHHIFFIMNLSDLRQVDFFFELHVHIYSGGNLLDDTINKNLSEQLQALYTSEFDVTAHHETAKLSDICHYSIEKVNVDELSTKHTIQQKICSQTR